MRPETGPMQFGDDWPGVFVRGDNASYCGFTVNQLLDAIAKEDWDTVKYLGSPIMSGCLRGVFSCRANDVDSGKLSVQRMKPIEQCLEATP